MSPNTQLVVGATIVWVICFLSAAPLSALCYASFSRLSLRIPPPQRSLAIAIYGHLPLIVATLVVCLLNFNVLYSIVLPEHCHNEMCTPHAPAFAMQFTQLAFGLMVALVVAAILLSCGLGTLFRQLRRLRLARQLAEPIRNYQLVDSRVAAAWCDGIWFPTVFISKGLLALLSQEELDVVLAHEQEHARRHDNLIRLLLSWVTSIWPAGVRGRLMRDFRCAAELACDAAAAQASSSREVRRVIRQLAADERTRSGEDTLMAERLSELAGKRRYDQAATLIPWSTLLLLCFSSALCFSIIAHPLLEWFSI